MNLLVGCITKCPQWASRHRTTWGRTVTCPCTTANEEPFVGPQLKQQWVPSEDSLHVCCLRASLAKSVVRRGEHYGRPAELGYLLKTGIRYRSGVGDHVHTHRVALRAAKHDLAKESEEVRLQVPHHGLVIGVIMQVVRLPKYKEDLYQN